MDKRSMCRPHASKFTLNKLNKILIINFTNLIMCSALFRVQNIQLLYLLLEHTKPHKSSKKIRYQINF